MKMTVRLQKRDPRGLVSIKNTIFEAKSEAIITGKHHQKISERMKKIMKKDQAEQNVMVNPPWDKPTKQLKNSTNDWKKYKNAHQEIVEIY